VGTESGLIHKCSTSYSDTYLENFVGHSSSVYKLKYAMVAFVFSYHRFSPFNADVFLSCSADWSLRLWHADDSQKQPLILISEKSTV